MNNWARAKIYPGFGDPTYLQAERDRYRQMTYAERAADIASTNRLLQALMLIIGLSLVVGGILALLDQRWIRGTGGLLLGAASLHLNLTAIWYRRRHPEQ